MTIDDFLLKNWGNKTFPVDPYLIAYQNNIEIRFCPKLKLEKFCQSKSYIENDNFIIEINPFVTTFQKKYLVAYHIGAYFYKNNNQIKVLYDSEKNIQISDFDNDLVDFVYKILAPKDFLNYIIFNLQISDLQTISEKMQLSTNFTTHALKKYKII